MKNLSLTLKNIIMEKQGSNDDILGIVIENVLNEINFNIMNLRIEKDWITNGKLHQIRNRVQKKFKSEYSEKNVPGFGKIRRKLLLMKFKIEVQKNKIIEKHKQEIEKNQKEFVDEILENKRIAEKRRIREQELESQLEKQEEKRQKLQEILKDKNEIKKRKDEKDREKIDRKLKEAWKKVEEITRMYFDKELERILKMSIDNESKDSIIRKLVQTTNQIGNISQKEFSTCIHIFTRYTE